MTSRHWTTVCTALTLALWANPLRARAEDKPLDANYLAAKVTLGFGGSGSLKSDSLSFGGITAMGNGTKSSDDLELSYGLAAQYMAPLHDYFVLGGLLGITSWQTKAGSDNNASRNLALDLAAVPEGRYAFTKTFELYLAVPIGITFDWFNQVESTTSVAGTPVASLSANTAVGFMFSALLGARLLLLSNFGVFTEVGYIHRQFSHQITGSAFGVSGKANADISTGQFAWNIGAFF
jgi:hypothetical protein